jgi:lipopolysaccharide cholinephosphotransferase
MARKLVLFGLIKNINLLFEADLWRDVILIVDNDNSKHGKYINGVLVAGPEKIFNVDYDEIIILSWAYNQIKSQLLSIGVANNVISSINKRLVTVSVFQDPDVRQVALAFISDFCKFAYDRRLKLFIEAGTLLGIVRDKDLIPWDTDIDFSIDKCDFLFANDVLSDFSVSFSSFYKIIMNPTIGGSDQITGEVIVQNRSIPFDIFTRTTECEHSLSTSGDFFACNSMHFRSSEKIIYDDYFFTAPADYKNYLSSLYGDDWSVPKYNFSYADFNYSK